MKFSTEYKNIHFEISLEKEETSDVSLLLGDKFNRLPNQTLLELKKGKLSSYNLLIISKDLGDKENEALVYSHYLSGILLTSDEHDIEEEVSNYLEQEEVIESIAALRDQYAITPGPHWRNK
jgi:hypothetical protein